MIATLALGMALMNQTEPVDLTKGRRLVFAEEFNKDGMVDETEWIYEVGKIRNHEAQYYTKARKLNARVEGGNLILEALKEPYRASEVTSASIQSRKAWLYGYFEVRAKVPSGKGTWPAIWFLGESIRKRGTPEFAHWPMCGELDLMEHWGIDPTRFLFSVHCDAYDHLVHQEKNADVHVADAEATYHTFGLDWHEDRLDFYYDGKRIYRYENDHQGKSTWPFDAPQFMILNLAIEGKWRTFLKPGEQVFPCRFLVDYVRVYQ